MLVASGGAIGAMLRFAITNIFKVYFNHSLLGTLIVNILGSFLIGYLISIGMAKNMTENFIKYFLIIGLLGSFTTFSSFSYEVIDLIISKKIILSILYITSSVFFCIVSAYIGIYTTKL